MKTALMVAEKPSLALALAKILSDNKIISRKGMSPSCQVHEWKGNFRSEPTHFKMTSVCGHVMSLDFFGRYNSWDAVDPAELFTCPTEKKEANDKMRIPAFLAHEAKGCDYLILWLDCDKEGENICFEVIDAVERSIKDVRSNRVTFRAKFSAITEKDIKHAMANLIQPNENEARSVDARQEIDLRIGCAFTRFQTKYFQGHYGDLDSSCISYGPCQTPTLGFCVQRHDEITNFTPETYWFVQLTAGRPEVTLEWARGRVFKKDVATMFLNNVKKFKDASVESVATKDLTKPRPLALNTVELMRAASSGLGLGPQTAMGIAERLYTQGYISYPRTETTSYPPNFDLIGVVKLFQPSSVFRDHASKILANFNQPRKGTDCGDHPPITPMALADRGDLDHDSWRVYDYICRHFLGSVSTDLRYKSTTAKLRVGTEMFSYTTSVLVDPGFTSIMTWLAFGADELTPPFTQGESVKINDAKLVERQTGPPDYLTESELITLMEKHGIGTDASIPVHINNISQRNYVTVTAGRKLEPTKLGIVLVHGYHKIDPELVLPTMRSDVEKLLNLIAAGTAHFDMVLHHALEIFRLKFRYFVSKIANMDSLFETSFMSIAESGRAYSRCGKCRRFMKYIQTKPARLHCLQCDETYTLPGNMNVRTYRDLRCPLDDFELLAYSSGTKGRSYPFCPYCYTHSPFKDMPKNAGCNSCPHPTCAQSMITLGVSRCAECDSGVLVLDNTSAPKLWKLGCNQCDVIITMFKGATKLTVDVNKTCEECESQLVNVIYKADTTKFKDGSDEKLGCVFCTAEFMPLVEKHRAVSSRPAISSARGGRGGGRGGAAAVSIGGGGRGGRGGARGPPIKDKMQLLALHTG